AYMNPYEFISGSLYTSVAKGDVGCGNERGVATGRDGETVICYSNIDFGNVGSDEITIPIFALSGDEYPIQIWEGVPGEQGSVMLADAVYQKPSIWNVYQPETFKLNKRLKGITTISFWLNQKVHIKGFSFTKYEKAWLEINAGEADAVYGDSYVRNGSAIEGIGNNVTLEFTDMDFGEKTIKGIAIKGRAVNGVNTIHLRLYNGVDEIKQIVEFEESEEYILKEFDLEPVNGKWDVSFVFLPGSNFDFAHFQFI
ncbi:MAG: glycoside hydrolase family 2, partial [Lachnospiraceae bacterium]|nr:glycoside hydrolase family 2 [Lachnospiraceae bacterium]